MPSKAPHPSSRPVFLLGLASVLVISHVLFSRSVAQGIGLATDFMPYTLPVHDALGGRPFVMIHHPPLYPLAILSVCRWLNLEPFAAAEVLQWMCHLTLPLIAGVLVRRMTSGAVLPSIFAMVTLAASPHVLDLGGQIASEHLFMILTLGALGMLCLHLEGNRGGRWLWASATLAGLAILTRYAGLALVATTFVLLLWQQKGRSERWREAVLASALALGPLLLHAIRNHLLHGNAVNREFGFKDIPWHKFDHGFQVMMTWWAPQSLVSFPAALLFVAVVATAWIWLISREAYPTEPSRRRTVVALRVLGVYSSLYVGFILGCMMFADAWIPFDHRILFPVQAAMTVALAGAAALIVGTRFPWRLATAAFLAALLCLNLRRGWLISGDYGAKGIGYAAHVNHATSFAEQVRRLPSQALLISNRPELAYCYTQRHIEGLPFHFDYLNARPARDLEGMLAALAAKASLATDAFVIAFPEVSGDCATPEALFRHAQFAKVWENSGGRIWRRTSLTPTAVP